MLEIKGHLVMTGEESTLVIGDGDLTKPNNTVTLIPAPDMPDFDLDAVNFKDVVCEVLTVDYKYDGGICQYQIATVVSIRLQD